MKKYLPTIIRLTFLALFIFLVQNGKPMLWFAVYGISLILSMIFGRIYCGYVCPMNTVMIPTEWLSKKFNIQTDRTPKWLESGKFAWIALFGSLAVMLFFRMKLNKSIPILLIWLAVSIAITLRYKPFVFHNLICFLGPPQKIFGKFARLSERVNRDECIGCYKCEKVCPSQAILVRSEDKKAEIKTSLCHQCTNCTQVCPTDAILYTRDMTRTSSNTNPL